MRSAPRFRIRLDGSRVLDVTLPIERAERVAQRAVGKHGRHTVAEILGPEDLAVITYIRITDK